jgi:predicted lipoprotein
MGPIARTETEPPVSPQLPLSSIPAAALVLLGAACPVVGPPPDEAARRSFTTNIVDEIVVPRLELFVQRAASLQTATDALAATGGDGVEERAAAQASWRDAMLVWQGLEALHLGPAGSPASFVGGQGLRDRIYAWPLVNLCAVDQQLVLGEFEERGWVEGRLPNVIGLAVLEYVLFVESDANACPESVSINADGSWATLGALEIRERRVRISSVLADDVHTLARALRDAWTSAGGFAETLRTAGEPGSLFATAQQALDEVYAALFAVELMTKDKKLGIPSGLHVDCPTDTCPDKAESRFSRTSKENVIENLDATRRVFLGIDRDGLDDTGFDDLLRERGADDLAATMTTNIDGAIAALRSFEGTLEDALITEPARVQALYQAVKRFTDDFKSTFPSTLGLRVPDEGAGDND